MGKITVATYKPWDIEKIAQGFLSRYWRASERWVDIEAIIERDLDVLIDYTSLQAPTILGCIARRDSDGRFVIVVQEELPDQRPSQYRFTLAQEVGHLLLHRPILESARTAEDAARLHQDLTDEQYQKMEADANRCAGAILLPEANFRAAVHESYETWFHQISQVTRVLAEDLLQRIVRDAAKAFEVSFDAARIRLERYPLSLRDAILQSANRGWPEIREG